MRRLTLLCIALLLAWSEGIPAQVSSQLTPGARVRIAGSGLRPDAGTLVAVEADTVVFQPEDRAATVRIPVASVVRLDVSRGRKSRIGAGIGYGALAGVAAGALGGAIVCKSQYSCSNPHQEEGDMTPLAALGGAIVGAVSGVVIGGIVGAVNSGERWERVSPDRWHLSVAPRPRGGLALAVSVTF